jgi:predicted membrane protein
VNGQIVRKTSGRSPSLIAVGVVVLTIGGILLAGALHWIKSIELLREVWPIGLVVIGIASLWEPSWRWSGFIWIVIGLFVYAKAHRWIDFNVWAVLPPAILLIVGGGILYRAFVGPLPRNAVVENNANYLRNTAIFSGTDLRPASQAFTGAELSAILGGIKLDLMNTDLPPEGAVLDVYIVMGGMELLVPSDWAVKMDTHAVMGGIVDNRRPSANAPTRTLTLRGFALLGGVEIRN